MFSVYKIWSGLLKVITLGMLILFIYSPVISADSDHVFFTENEKEWLKDHPSMRLGVDPGWKPFEYFEEGRYQGLASSYISILSNQLSTEMRPEAGLSWVDVIEKAKVGEVDVLPCVVNTAVRSEFLNFTEPYLNFPMVIVAREDARFIRGIETIIDYEIGAVEGYATIDLLKEKYPNIHFKLFKNLDEGLKAVSLGRIDYFVDNLASISYVINHDGLVNLKIAAETPFAFELAIGVRKDWPELVPILNKVLANISEQDKNEILQKWISIRFDRGIDNQLLITIIALVIFVIIAVFFIFYFKNRLLAIKLNAQENDALIAKISRALDTEAGEDFFQTLVNELSSSLASDYAFIGQYEEGTKKIKAFAVCGHGKKMPAFIYDLVNTPCQVTINRSVCIVPEKAQQEYPEDEMMADMGINGYAGKRLENSSGNAIGVLVVLSESHFKDVLLVEHLLHIFAVRAQVEIERQTNMAELQKLSQAIQHSPTAVVITDLKGVVEYVNPMFSQITGYSEKDVLNHVYKTFMSEDENSFQQMQIMHSLHAGEHWQGEMRNMRKDGTYYWASENIAPVLNEAGFVTNFIAMLQDFTEVYEATQQVSYQASYDNLTGLINRQAFEIKLDLAVKSAIRENHEHILCFLDLDQFKMINDSVGHIAGDEMLKQISEALQNKLTDTDVLARLGGDEFAVLISHCSIEKGLDKAQELLSVIEDFRFAWDDKVFTSGMSIGIAKIDSTIKSNVEALKFADIACYNAKDAGRNRIHIYQADDDQVLQRSGDMLWTARINKALEQDEFLLFVQEIRPTDPSLNYVNYEILIRMKGEEEEVIAPGVFLPTAERFNLITKIDLWVIDHTFSWLKKHANKFHPDMHFSVNLSGQSMGDVYVLSHIIELLESGLIEAKKINFEVTETMAIANLKGANDFINAVKKYGCKFSLDDFGSGLSSFGYLKNLNVDVLKIDGMFVRDIMDDAIDEEMVSSINNIGHVMGMETIAEFVENEQIAEKLIDMGVNYLQGYGIGKPRPMDEILKSDS